MYMLTVADVNYKDPLLLSAVLWRS